MATLSSHSNQTARAIAKKNSTFIEGQYQDPFCEV